LKGCHSQGDTFEEALENITEAISLYVESLGDRQSLSGWTKIGDQGRKAS